MFRKRNAQQLKPTLEERSLWLEKGILRIPLDTPYPVDAVNLVLLLGDPPALIDTGLIFPGNMERLQESLASVDLKIEDIGEIYLTHPHLDHFGLTAQIAKRSGASVYVWEHCAHRFEDYLDLWEQERPVFIELLSNSGCDGTAISKMAKEKTQYHSVAEPFEITDTFSVDRPRMIAGKHLCTPMHVPGHSPWCVAFWLEESQSMVLGDLVLERITPNPLWYPPNATPPTWQGILAYQSSLQRVLDLPVKAAIPGHGRGVLEPASILERALRHQLLRGQRLEILLEGGPKHAFELAGELFGPALARQALFLVMSEVFRHLDRLIQLEKVEKQTGSCEYYRKIAT